MAKKKKTWAKPKIEWIEMQAEEYVSACMITPSAGASRYNEAEHCVVDDNGNYYFFNTTGTDKNLSYQEFMGTALVHNHDNDAMGKYLDMSANPAQDGWLFTENDVNAVRDYITTNGLQDSQETLWQASDPITASRDNFSSSTYTGSWLASIAGVLGIGKFGYYNRSSTGTALIDGISFTSFAKGFFS